MDGESTNSANEGRVEIKLTPERLDMGKMPPSNVPVDLSFVIENIGETQFAVVDIMSSCGCTVVDIPREPVLPGEKVSSTVRVSINDRRGSFVHEVAIRTEPAQVVLLEIVGEISLPFWYDGQAIRCTAGIDSKQARTTFNVYTEDYPEVSFEFLNLCKEITIDELSRSTSGGETTIKFSVVVNVEDDSPNSHQIVLKPVGIEVNPLVIPLHVYRQTKSQTLPAFSTLQISLGTIQPQSTTEFHVHGDPDLIHVIDTVSLLELPDNFSLERTEKGTDDKKTMTLLLLDSGGFSGMFSGKLQIKTFGGREYTIPISGFMVPTGELTPETEDLP